MSSIEIEMRELQAKLRDLRAENGRLREALDRIHVWLICPNLEPQTIREMQIVAGNALAERGRS